MALARGVAAGAAQWTVTLAADAQQDTPVAETQTAPTVTGGTADSWSWTCIDPVSGASSTAEFDDAALETPVFTPGSYGVWEIRCAVTVGAATQETSRSLEVGIGGGWQELDLTQGTLQQPGADVIHSSTTWAANGSTVVLDAGVEAQQTTCSRKLQSVGNPPTGAVAIQVCLQATGPGSNPSDGGDLGLLALVSNDDGSGVWANASGSRAGLAENKNGVMYGERPRTVGGSHVQNTTILEGKATTILTLPMSGSTVFLGGAAGAYGATSGSYGESYNGGTMAGTAAPLYVGIGAFQSDAAPTAGTVTWTGVRMFVRWLIDPTL